MKVIIYMYEPVCEPAGEHVESDGGRRGGQRRALVPQALNLLLNARKEINSDWLDEI